MNPNDFDLKKIFSVKFLKIVLIVILSAFLFFVLITGGNILWFRGILNWFISHIYAITGWDIQLVKAIAALLTGFILIVPLSKLIWAVSPIPMKNQKVKWYQTKKFYRWSIFAGISLMFLFAYFGSKDTYFNPLTGEGEKYVSIRPNGKYYIKSSPGYDPVTGYKLKKVTNEISLQINGLMPALDPEEEKAFFDPKTGNPKRYFSIRPNGGYYLSTEPGYDPFTGDKLIPVTREASIKINGLLSKDGKAVGNEIIVDTFAINENKAPDPVPKKREKPLVNSSSESKPPSKGLENNDYSLPKQVNPEYRSTKTKKVTYSDDFKGVVNFDNQTSQRIIIFSPSNKEQFRVSPFKKGVAKMYPGDYFFVVYGSREKIFFTVKERSNFNLEFSNRNNKVYYYYSEIF